MSEEPIEVNKYQPEPWEEDFWKNYHAEFENSRASVAYYSFPDTDAAWKFCSDHLEDWRNHCQRVAGKFNVIVTDCPLFLYDEERLLESMVAEYEYVRCSFKDEKFQHKERVIFEAACVCMFLPHS